MAYRRRYFAALTITTTAYGEKSITTDKLADDAVTHPKLAPGSVDSESVINESLKSEDIKDGEIKTSDLAPGAVTTEKILDGAVTTQKLEASIQGIARPLTPGVDTDEIQDGKVTLAKLAPDSVDASKIKPGAVGSSELAVDACEESRIKDGAISTAKIAGSAIDQTKIAVNAVTGSEILNGSVGHTELATDSVITVKVKDRNISSPKIAIDGVITENIIGEGVTDPKLNVAALARRHIESKDTRVITHREEFGGIDMSNKWAKSGDAGGLVYPVLSKGVYIGTGAVNGNSQRIDFGGEKVGESDAIKPIVDIYIPDRSTPITYFTNILGLWNSANNQIVFYAHDDAGAVPNWIAKCVSAGNPTTIDTGIAVTDDVQLLTIKVIDAALVEFYIDGDLVAEVTTDIPTGFEMEPRLEIITRTAAIRTFFVNYFSYLGVRPAYA